MLSYSCASAGAAAPDARVVVARGEGVGAAGVSGARSARREDHRSCAQLYARRSGRPAESALDYCS